MRKRGGLSPVTVVWGTLLLLAIALGAAAIWLVQRRHGTKPPSANAVDLSGDGMETPPAAPEIEIRDDCVLGSPDCELVWIPDLEDKGSASEVPPSPSASESSPELPSKPPTQAAPHNVIHETEAAPSPSPAPPRKAMRAPTVASVAPPRDALLLPPARPLPASPERSITSPAFEAISAHSMNPPVQPASEADAAVRAELESRLVIVVGMGVHSGSEQTRAKIQAKGVHGGLPLFEVHVPSFLTVAQPNFIYRQGAAAG